MVCNVIDECRCYQLRGNPNQFCAVRRGDRVLRCPEDCCSGGCVNDGSRPPFRYIDIPDIVNTEPLKTMDRDAAVNHVLRIFICLCIVLIIDLKIRGLRKV
jgi:hypothetical protein